MIQRFSHTVLTIAPEAQAYAVVNDVTNYPDFIPHCTQGKIISLKDHEMHAQLSFLYRGIKMHFSTLNQLEDGSIHMKLVDSSMIQTLEGLWQFKTHQQGTQMSCHVQILWKNPIMDQLTKKLGQYWYMKTLEIFAKRADEQYHANQN